MPKITIAIDGHSSTGKSTVARQLADYLGYIFVDTGAMYRAVTLYALRAGFISETAFDTQKLIDALPDISVAFRKNDDGVAEIHLNGENVERQIRTLEVSEHVSPVSAISEVRNKLVEQQRQMGEGGGIVMDGRDIGTVVFPNADLKIFLTASTNIRAQRRYDELIARGDEISLAEVRENVIERDQMDSTRDHSPLKRAENAILIDNSETNQEDQFYTILQLAKDRIAGRI